MSDAGKSRRTAVLVKLLLVAILTAAVAALAVSNWRDRVFSLIVANVQMKAGIVILASVLVGFVLGCAFLWSASHRD